MSTGSIALLRELLTHIEEPTQRLIIEQIIAELDVSRAHEQQVSGEAQLGVAVAGDSQGAINVDQSVHYTHTQRVINILLASGDTEAIVTALAAAGVATDLKPMLKSPRQQRADQLFTLLLHLSLPAAILRRAFSKTVPFHDLPEPTDGSLLQSILFELVHNTISEFDPVERFARTLLTESDLTPTQEAALCQWLGLSGKPQKKSGQPGLFIAIDRVPNSNELYHIFAWRWPDRLKLWPPVGEEMRAFSVSELPQVVHTLYQRIYKHIAWFGEDLRIELMLHHSLLVEPSHEWKVAVLFDEDDPDDIIEQPLYVGHQVFVRSVERALSPKGPMVNARALWRARWAQLSQVGEHNWRRPQCLGAAQHPPLFCPTDPNEFNKFDEELFNQSSEGKYLCFVETVAPPEKLDFAKRVVLRIIRAGIPLGVWFAHNADRNVAMYQHLGTLLDSNHLANLPHIFRQHWKEINGNRPLVFYDDPNRLPIDPDDAGLETPSIV